jgi:LysR family glycine cleavage system transcriptional activator
MRKLPPLNALQVFETVARHQNITHAANYLCLTQGAVSRQILILEEYYGFPLFQRHARGLTLTEEGELLLPAVRESFARIEEISTRLTRQRTDLALKVPTCIMRWIYPKIMLFQAAYPDIQLQVTTALQHNVDFQRESFDAAIVYGAPTGKDTHSLLLFTEQLTPVCSPAMLKEQPHLEPEHLAQQTLLHPTRDHRDWEMWLRFAGVKGVDASSGQSFETLDLAVNAAAQGFGVAIGDCILASDDLEMQRLVKPFDCVMPGQSYYFVYPESVANQQKIAIFREWIAQHCMEHAAPLA